MKKDYSETATCLNCGKPHFFEIVAKGVSIFCSCGCFQACLGVDESGSKWRVMNPPSFKSFKNR